MDYSGVIKKAFHITKSHPLTWLFGLLFAGGFLENISWSQSQADAFVILLFFGVLFVWAYVIFILYVSDIAGIERLRSGVTDERPNLSVAIKESRRFVIPAATVSICMGVLAWVFYMGATQYFWNSPAPMSPPWLSAYLVFVLVGAFFVLINSFSVFFIVLFQKSPLVSVGLALDLVQKRWKAVLQAVGISLLLYVCYITIGVLILSFYHNYAGEIFSWVGVIVIWAWAVFCSAFFHVGLLLFFAELVKPVKDNEVKENQPDLRPIPAPSS